MWQTDTGSTCQESTKPAARVASRMVLTGLATISTYTEGEGSFIFLAWCKRRSRSIQWVLNINRRVHNEENRFDW